MRQLTSFATLLLVSFAIPRAMAQPDTLWTARVTASGNPAIYNAINHSSGGFVLVGETNPAFSNSNTLIARMGPSGAILWTNTFGSNGNDAAYACLELPNGSYVLAGNSGNNNVQLSAVNAVGDSVRSRSYTSGGSSSANDVIMLQDGNFAVVGFGVGSDGVHSDIWLLKCDQNLDTLWTRKFGGNDNDYGNRIEEQSDGTLIIAGTSRSNGGIGYQFWLLHVDSEGNVLSSDSYGGAGQDYCYDFVDADSVFYLCGKSTLSGSNSGYLARLSNEGDSLFVRSYSNVGVEDQLRGVIARSSGSAICAGWSGSSWNTRQCWLMETNIDGSVAWQWIHGSEGSGFYGMLAVTTGGFIAYGQINELNVRKGYVARMFYSEISGNVVDFESGAPVAGAHVEILGEHLFATTDQNGNYKIGIPNGTYDVSVYGDCISRDTVRSVIVEQDSVARVDFDVYRPEYERLQSSINAVVQNHVQTSLPFHVINRGNGSMEISITASTANPSGNWLSVTPDTALIQAGDTLTVQVLVSPDTTDDGSFDYLGNLHVRTNSCPISAETIPVLMFVLDANEAPSILPDEFSLAAYPNPFNSATTIAFELPQPTCAKITLFDISGRQVSTLTDLHYASGSHSILFNADALPSGIYLAHLTAGSFHSTQKIVLIR